MRVGISEGKGIIYKDVNGNYNVAGSVINLASRVMGLVDRSQIAFTEEAYRQLIDLIDDPNLSDRFIEFTNVRMKHNVKINFYQYIGKREAYINSGPPEDTTLITRFSTLMDQVAQAGFPPHAKSDAPHTAKDALQMVNVLEQLVPLMSTPGLDLQGLQIILPKRDAELDSKKET